MPAVCICALYSPEGVPRLFDLVRVKDDCFRPVFYFALRDTLVADNLEQATRIAYGRKRNRVVTLSGQLIETSGQALQHLNYSTPGKLYWTCLCSHGFPATALEVFRPKLSDQGASLPGTSYVSITIQCRDMDCDLGGSAETRVVPYEMSATAA